MRKATRRRPAPRPLSSSGSERAAALAGPLFRAIAWALVSTIGPASAGLAGETPCVIDASEALDLAPGVSVDLSVDRDAPCRLYRLAGRAGQTLVVTLSGPGPLEAASLLLREGSPPTSTLDADLSSSGRPGATVTLVAPVSFDGTAFVLVRGELLDAVTPAAWQIHHESREGPVIANVTPDYAGELRPSTSAPPFAAIAVSGGGFDSGTRFFFVRERAGEPTRRFETTPRVLGAGAANLGWSLTGVPIGIYDLEAIDGDGRADLARDAFEIRSSRGQAFHVSLRGPEILREDASGILVLSVQNAGDETLPTPIVRIREARRPRRLGFRVARSSDSLREELLVFAREPGSTLTELTPGESIEVWIEVSSRFPCEDPELPAESCELIVEAEVFKPSARDFIEWRQLGNPDREEIADAEWDGLLSGLSVDLGRTWSEFQRRLSDRDRRLARRSADAAPSIDQAFRLTALETLRRPSAAVIGVLRDFETREPVVDALVVAHDPSDRAIASAHTDAGGRFCLEGVRPGSVVRLGVSEFTIVRAQGAMLGPQRLAVVMIPRDVRSAGGSGDASVGLLVGAGGPTRDEPPDPGLYRGVPRRVPDLPDGLFVRVAAWSQRLASSIDPNDKTGCVGPGDLRTIGDRTGGPYIDYTIRFENSRCTTVSAREVEIVDTLDPSLFDLETLEVGMLSIGGDDAGKLIPLAEPLWGRWRVDHVVRGVRIGDFETDPDALPLECAGGALPECDGSEESPAEPPVVSPPSNSIGDVGVTISLEPSAELAGAYDLRWLFRSCERGCFPTEGFLPPNDCASHQGEGFVTFRIAAVASSGDLGNSASLRFDDRSLSVSTSTRLDPSPPAVVSGPQPSHDPLDERPVAVDTSLVWSADPDATSWRLSVWRLDESGLRVETIEDALELDEPVYLVSSPWLPATSHEWEVLALGPAGISGSASTWRFRTEGPLPPPPDLEITLVEPPPGATLDPDAVVLEWSGEGPDDATWTVFVWPSDADRGDASAHVGTATRYDPLELADGTVYSWQIVAAGPGGETPGPVGSFATMEGARSFVRGDANADGNEDLSDAVGVLGWLFLGATPPPCLDAADVDDSGQVEITDAISLLGFLFLGGTAPAPPFPGCGEDGGAASLGCESSPDCA